MTLVLPRFIGLFERAIDPPRFVRFAVEDGPRNGYMRFGLNNDEGVMSPFVKLEVVSANMSDEALVHLRSCYNNKFLRKASEEPSDIFLAAAADSPNPDTSKWNSTVFRLHRTQQTPAGPNLQFTLLFSGQRGSIVSTSEGNVEWCGVIPGGRLRLYNLIDLVRIVPLPRFVAFKGDNGRYLRIVNHNGRQFASFQAPRATDVLEAQFEVISQRDGSILIRPTMNIAQNVLIADPAQQNVFLASSVANQRSLGELVPHRLGSDGGGKYIPVALWHVSRQTYCARSNQVLANSLQANSRTIGVEAEFQVEELIRRREMFNPRFMFRDSMIYDPSPVTIVSKDITNRSLVSTQGGELSFSYTEFESSEWQTTHSWQLGDVI